MTVLALGHLPRRAGRASTLLRTWLRVTLDARVAEEASSVALMNAEPGGCVVFLERTTSLSTFIDALHQSDTFPSYEPGTDA